MLLKLIRLISRTILRIIAKVEIVGLENIPQTGGCIVVSNHLGRLDAMLAVVQTDRTDILLMIAEKYQKYIFWRWLAKELNALWLNRFEADFHTLRVVTKRLKEGEILALAPEGTRSQAESLLPGKPGAAFLAAKTNVPIIPAALTGTEDRVVKERFRRLQRLHITIIIGKPFMLPPMKGVDRDEYLKHHTDEIMCQIAALLPLKYRGVYENHPRLQELLARGYIV